MDPVRSRAIAELEGRIHALPETSTKHELSMILAQIRQQSDDQASLSLLTALVESQEDIAAGRVYTQEQVEQYFNMRLKLRKRAS